jgi:phosphotransferase system enzyme I (PtsI)
MQKLQGIAVSPGTAIGEALVMGNEGFRIPRRFLARDAVDDELDRLNRAFDAATVEIQRNRDTVARELGKEYGAIFEAHLQMLRDPRLRSELEQMIRERHYSPEYALSRTLRRYVKVFQSLDSGYMAQRAGDIFDIEKRLLRHLLGRRREEISSLTSPVLVLAHNLTPSETANLDRRFVRGFVTEIGGAGSHTAIVAEALEIPAVVGTGPFLSDVSGGDVVIIDGDQGLVILHPDEETIARYRHEVEERRTMTARLESLRDLPAETADGVRIQLLGNIEFPHEVAHCIERGADGIGLYRTEFLYLGAEVEPDEEAHYRAYSEVLQAMGRHPVVIRTLDLGADKLLDHAADEERNPFLGLRSIRLSLRNLPMFRTQLRAILRASTQGDVRIMFPLISTMLELRQAKMVLADVMEDLEEHDLAFNRSVKVGMMVEVPSAVMMIDHFVSEVDFLSIGTNDLIQYTLAVDRSNKDVASLYTASDPAVIKLIEIAVNAARRKQIPVNLCGQMSGNSIYTMLLLGLGLRQLSVPPSAIPEIKKVCRSVTIGQCEAVAAHVLTLENARDIKSFLKEELKRVLPEMVG